MGLRPRLLFWLPWLCSLAACGSDPAAAYIRASGEELQLEFFVLLREGRPSEVVGPAAVRAGPVELSLQDEDELVRVLVPGTSLVGRDPLLDDASIRRLELRAASPCSGCGDLCVENENTRLSLPLPPESEITNWADGVFELAERTQIERVLTQTRLELERSSDRCRWASAQPPERFGTTGTELEVSDRGFRVVDENRLLISSTRRLMLVMRGRDLEDNERRVLTTSGLAYESLSSITTVSVTSTSVRFLLGVHAPESQIPPESVVYEIEATEDGIRVLRERLRVAALLGPLHSLPDGGFLAAGYSGVVFISRPEMPLRSFSLGANLRITAIREFGDDVGRFHVGGAFGFVAEGDLLLGPEAMTLSSVQRAGGIVDSSITTFKYAAAPGGGEVFALTRGQGIFRRIGVGAWEGVDVAAPPGVTACATPRDACGRSQLIQIIEGVDFGPDGRLFHAPWMCPSLFSRNPADACTQEVELPGVPQPDSRGLTTLHVAGNRLYFIINREIWYLEL